MAENSARFIGHDGVNGTIIPAVEGTPFALQILLDDGRSLTLDAGQLQDNGDGTYSARESPLVIPVVAESLEVGKRTVVTGKVTISKTAAERQQTVASDLLSQSYEILRVPMDRVLETPPEVRHEGDTTIYPVVEEVLVLTKQLVLREEIHVTRKVNEIHYEQVVSLLREDVSITREPADSPQK